MAHVDDHLNAEREVASFLYDIKWCNQVYTAAVSQILFFRFAMFNPFGEYLYSLPAEIPSLLSNKQNDLDIYYVIPLYTQLYLAIPSYSHSSSQYCGRIFLNYIVHPSLRAIRASTLHHHLRGPKLFEFGPRARL